MLPCTNGCGWSAYKLQTRQYSTCCTHCKPGGMGPHAKDCATKNKKVLPAAAAAELGCADVLAEADTETAGEQRSRREAAEEEVRKAGEPLSRTEAEEDRENSQELSEESELETEESDGSDPEYTGRGGDSDQDSDDEPDLRRTPPSGCAVKGGSYASGFASPSPASPCPADSGSPSCGPAKSPRRPKSRNRPTFLLLGFSPPPDVRTGEAYRMEFGWTQDGACTSVLRSSSRI